MDEKVLMGLLGTAISATGASISVNELQAIISIIVTVLGFLISVVIPLGVKLYKKIKKAKEDGVITKEEKEDIINTIEEGIEDIKDNLPKKEDKEN